MKPLLLALSLLLVGVSLPAGVDGAAHTCTLVPVSPATRAPAPDVVTGVLGALGGVTCGALTFTSAAKDCPGGGFVGPVDGAYCGPLVPPGHVVRCSFDPVGPLAPHTVLVVGFDVDDDGYVDVGTSELAALPMDSTRGAWEVTNVFHKEVAIIAYPTSTTGVHDPFATTYVACA